MRLVWTLLLYIYSTSSLYAKLPDIPVTTKIGQHQLQLPDKLLQTEQGLWIADESGLYRVTGNKHLHFDSSNSPLEGSVTELLQDEFDNVWIATDVSGLLHFNSQTHEFKEIKNIAGEDIKSCFDISSYKNKVYALCSDVLIEVDTELVGVTKNILKEEFGEFEGEANSPILGYFIRQAKTDKLGNVWLSGRGYLYRYNIDSKSTDKFKIKHEMPKVADFPYALYIDLSNRVWLLGEEVVLLLEKNNDKYEFKRVERDCVELCFRFRTAFEDSSGDLWFAGASLEKYDENRKRIFQSKSLYPTFVKNKTYFIDDIEEGSNGEVYFASDIGLIELPEINESIRLFFNENGEGEYTYAEYVSEGLVFANGEGGVGSGFYDLDGQELYSFSSELYRVGDILKYNDNLFLILDEKGNLFEFDIKYGTFENINYKLGGDLSGVSIYSFSVHDGNIVFSSGEGCIYRGDFDSGFGLINSEINARKIFHDSGGDIYFNDFLGKVYRYNKSGEWKYWNTWNNNRKLVSSGGFFEDANGSIWIYSGRGGIGRLDESSSNIEFVESDLINEEVVVYDAVVDSQGYFWLITSSRFIRYDPKTNTSIFLGRSEGIEERSSFDIKTLPSGKLFLAGDYQTYIIDIMEVNSYLDKRIKLQSHTSLHSIVVSDKRQSESINRISDIYLAEGNKPFEITHNEYLFTIEFAVNNFIERNNFGFEYRLLGLGDEWVQADPLEGTATYSTLPAGDYTFEVRAVDKKSIVEQPITRLNIKVLPPFWLTWKAYSTYVLVFLSLFYFIYRYRTQQLKQMNLQLETSVQERTAELASSNARVSNLLKQKETLFANVSHEFRTPLTLISGPLEKLQEQISSEKGHQYFDIMQRNTQRLTQLVEQILDLSHLETAISSEKQLYDIETAIPILVESFKPLAMRKKQKLILNHHCLGGLELTKDALEKIILNLLSNAIKYTPLGGTITIVVKEVDNHFCLRITDTGDGISEEDLSKIFERFTRLDNSDSEMGSGLGLALVKELVAANHGQINVTSQIGKGTTFTLMFPLVSSFDRALVSSLSEGLLSINQQPQPADIALNEQVGFVRETDGASEKPTLLIIEDNKDMRSFIQQSLQEHYRCLTAADGQVGIDLAIEHIPDLILSDLMMPVRDGFEVVDSIRQNELSAHIPIILLTARGDDKSRLTGWQKAVDDYIPKPFNVDELLLRIARLISIRGIIKKRMRHATDNQVEGHIVKDELEPSTNDLLFDSPKDHVFFNKLMDIIKLHYNDEHFGRAVAAGKLAISERQLNRKLSALVDYNFNELLRRFRLEKAKKLIKAGEQIGNVCYEVGFTSPSYFSRCFKAEFGCSPREFGQP